MPESFVPEVVDLLIKYPVVFKIVKPRKSKLGDFRMKNSKGKMQITINSDLNPYNFLITTLHEFAHLITFVEYGARVSAHGLEWQESFRQLLIPVIESKKLPEEIEKALQNTIRKNIKASSCTDYNLSRVLMQYDEIDSDLELLENVPSNTRFELNGKVFLKGELRRTRFLCEEEKSGKKYLVNHLAKVNRI